MIFRRSKFPASMAACSFGQRNNMRPLPGPAAGQERGRMFFSQARPGQEAACFFAARAWPAEAACFFAAAGPFPSNSLRKWRPAGLGGVGSGQKRGRMFFLSQPGGRKRPHVIFSQARPGPRGRMLFSSQAEVQKSCRMFLEAREIRKHAATK